MGRDKIIFKNKWISFYYNVSHFAFTVAPASYFDNRWHMRMSIPILISIIGIITGSILGLGIYSLYFVPLFFIPWGPIYIYFPIYSKWDECDPPEYGIAYHGNKIWIYTGGNGNLGGGRHWKTLTMPWEYNWVRTSTLKKEALFTNPACNATDAGVFHEWLHEVQGNRVDTWKDEIKAILWKKEYPYTYVLESGEVQNRIATIGVSEREWRQKWLRWTKLFSKIRRDLDVDFNEGTGEGVRSWKGGTTGCSYNMLLGETPEQTLRRMEKERKFSR